MTPLDIAFGLSPGFKLFQAVGFNAAISNSANNMLGPSLGEVATSVVADANRIHLLDVAGTLSVARADAGDTGRVVVSYLDEQWFERIAVYELDAPSKTTTVDAKTITAKRVNGARYIDGGNAGAIDLLIGGNLANRIRAGDGLARVCLYTVPAGQRVALTGFVLASQSSKPVEVRLLTKLPGKLPYVLDHFPARETFEFLSLPIPREIRDVDLSDPAAPVEFSAGIDLFIDARRPSGQDNAEVACTMTFAAQQTGFDPVASGFTRTAGAVLAESNIGG
jgi:hypothetical protein